MKTFESNGQQWLEVSYKTYSFNGELFTVRQDFWNAFDACPNAIAVSEGGSIGVGMDDFTLNYSNIGVVRGENDPYGQTMLVSRPSMLLN